MITLSVRMEKLRKDKSLSNRFLISIKLQNFVQILYKEKRFFFLQKAVYTKSKNINVLLLAINNTTKMKIPYNIWIQY